MARMFKHYTILAFISLALASCSGGLNCPVSVPSCCTNVLFGCGTFDLPFGCECSDYGFFSRPIQQNISSARASTKNDREVAGTWTGILNQQSNSCTGLLPSITGAVKVKRRGKVVSVSLPHNKSLRGKLNSTGYSVTGSYAPFDGCSAKARIKFTKARSGTGRVQAALNLRCNAGTSCSALYSGVVQKQLR